LAKSGILDKANEILGLMMRAPERRRRNGLVNACTIAD